MASCSAINTVMAPRFLCKGFEKVLKPSSLTSGIERFKILNCWCMSHIVYHKNRVLLWYYFIKLHFSFRKTSLDWTYSTISSLSGSKNGFQILLRFIEYILTDAQFWFTQRQQKQSVGWVLIVCKTWFANCTNYNLIVSFCKKVQLSY